MSFFKKFFKTAEETSTVPAGTSLTPVSTAVQECAYLPISQMCIVRYKNGQRVYVYSDVTPNEYAEIVNAKSTGVAVNHILKGKHEYQYAQPAKPRRRK